MVCKRCGSIDITRAQSRLIDKVIRFFTGLKRFVCRRCGWKVRRWGDDGGRPDWRKIPAADSHDPAMAVLDDDEQAQRTKR